jgi:hypothetical protein
MNILTHWSADFDDGDGSLHYVWEVPIPGEYMSISASTSDNNIE